MKHENRADYVAKSVASCPRQRERTSDSKPLFLQGLTEKQYYRNGCRIASAWTRTLSNVSSTNQPSSQADPFHALIKLYLSQGDNRTCLACIARGRERTC